MPILDVEVVRRAGESLPAGLSRAIADAAAEVFGAAAGSTWVRLRAIDDGSYAENGVSPGETPSPVFVTVLKARLPKGEALAAEARALAGAVARACDRPEENVHVLYQPPALGRIAFGGRLRTD